MPRLKKRQLRRLEALLPGGFQVGTDGLDGQAGKHEIREILDAVRAARMCSTGLSGAIVPYGYGWKHGHGHAENCECAKIAAAGDVNTLACRVAEAYAAMPALVAWPSDLGVE